MWLVVVAAARAKALGILPERVLRRLRVMLCECVLRRVLCEFECCFGSGAE